MAEKIKVGEKVLASIRVSGRYGTRQVVGKLVKILDKPDDYGRKYIVEVKDKLWLSGKPVTDTYKAYKIRRAGPEGTAGVYSVYRR